jgi:hypothetical protein
MFRRWLRSAVLLGALLASACGRQVTGLDAPGAGSIQSGHMLIRFQVAGPLDFTNVRYLIVINTTGNGQEPYPSPNTSGYGGYSFGFVVGGNALVSGPELLQYFLAPGGASGLQTIQIPLPPQDYVFVPNSSSDPNTGEFTLTFLRALLAVPLPTATMSPVPQPTTAAQRYWAINFITVDPKFGTPIDSMGLFGATDTTFTKGIVNTTQSFDLLYTKPTGTSSVANPSAQLTGFEIINAP